MAVYTQLSTEEIAAFVAQAYALGELRDVQGITEGVENSNYRLLLGSEPVILTIYEQRVRREDLPFFLRLMQHLAKKGVACPLPLPRRDGALWGEVAGKPAALVSFLPGKSRREFRADHTRAAGVLLGQLHRAGQDFIATRANALGPEGWKKLHAAMGARLDAIAPGLADMVRQELAFLENHWPADVPRGVVHADLFPDNVFFTGDAISGVIDFYFACNDLYAYDLAITINAWCFDQDRFQRDRAVAMLAGYESVRPLSAAEKQALPILLRGAALRFLLTRAQLFLDTPPGAQVVPHDPNAYVAILRHHQEHAWPH